MIKLAIPLAVGLAIGLGGSTAAVMFLGGGSGTLTESLAEAVGEEGDSTGVDGAEHAGNPGAADDGTLEADAANALLAGDPGAHADPAGGPPVDPAAVAVTAMTPVSEPATPGMTTAALAELFATMQAREAARVLEHMEDQEVQVILGQLGNREAAAILSNLTPERAAVISRTILRGERSAP